MLYEDFVISFGPTTPNGTQVRVLDSPSGQGAGLFQPPSSLERTRSLLPGLWRDLQVELLPEPISLRQIGGELFRSIFSGQIEELFEHSLSRIEVNGRGLRIKLVFDLFDKDAAHLQSLPWEFLYRSRTQDFLALNRFTPIVRFLQIPPRPISPNSTTRNLRVLIVTPQPFDMHFLNVEEECRLIEQALSPLANVQTIRLEQPTLPALREALRSEEIHVVHFSGSAGYDAHTGEGALLFEDEHRASTQARGDQLAFILNESRSVRLVFLNSCDTARVIGHGNTSPFRSVALSLLIGGIPAVIGMQFPISDSAAVCFSEAFYNRFAAGDPIDTAITDGRQAVYVRDPDSMEWGTPVLYTRTSDGALFDARSRHSKSRLLVFLCHSSGDKEFVRNLYRRLTIDGYDVWLDEERILPGKAWEPEINRALRSSHVIIICLSKSSVTKAGFVQKEIAIALDLLQQQPEESIFLIPAKIEECGTPDRLRHLQFVRIDEEKGYQRLLTALEQRARDLQLDLD